jgi:hypothetical protein
VPFNPCGRVVDFARRPYKTLARFFKDRPDILVEIQWYPAALDAPKLPFTSSFLSLDWTSSTDTRNDPNYPDEPWLQRPGEVFGEPRPYSFKAPLLGVNYDHFCGTEEQFAFGAVYDPDLDVQYDEQGLPLCCQGPAVPEMGMLVGLDLITEPPLEQPCDECPSDVMRWLSPVYLVIIDDGTDEVLAFDQWAVSGSLFISNWFVGGFGFDTIVDCGGGAGPVLLRLRKFGDEQLNFIFDGRFCRLPPLPPEWTTDFYGIGSTGTVRLRWQFDAP